MELFEQICLFVAAFTGTGLIIRIIQKLFHKNKKQEDHKKDHNTAMF